MNNDNYVKFAYSMTKLSGWLRLLLASERLYLYFNMSNLSCWFCLDLEKRVLSKLSMMIFPCIDIMWNFDRHFFIPFTSISWNLGCC